MKKTMISLIENKRNDKVQRAHTYWNLKKHISVLFRCTMVAVHCFIWPPMSTVLQADKNCVCFKSLPGCVLFFMLHLMLDGLIQYYSVKVIFMFLESR